MPGPCSGLRAVQVLQQCLVPDDGVLARLLRGLRPHAVSRPDQTRVGGAQGQERQKLLPGWGARADLLEYTAGSLEVRSKNWHIRWRAFCPPFQGQTFRQACASRR